MGSQYAFGAKEDDAIIKHRLLTRVSVTRGEPPMRRLVKKLAALAAEAAKEDWYDVEGGEGEGGEGEGEGGEGEGELGGEEGLNKDINSSSHLPGSGGGAAGREGGLEASAEDGPSTDASLLSQKAMAECEKSARAFLLELAAFEQPLVKAGAVIAANQRDQQQFRELQLELLQQIDVAKDSISHLKVQLDEARAYRQQEEECELVRHQIAQHPPRAESEAAIVGLQQELEALEKENVAASRVLELRRKQFSLLLHTIDELQSTLEDSDDPMELEEIGGHGSSEAKPMQ